MKRVLKEKRCKVCPNTYTPYVSTQVVCSTACAIEYAKKKRVDDEVKKWRKEKKKRKEELLTIPEMIARTRDEVHRYIRERDLGKTCITCPVLLTRDLKYDAGHFYSSQHSAIRFDYSNIHGQCVQCNQHLHSNPHVYRRNIVSRIGQDELDRLDREAYKSVKWDRSELERIRIHARSKYEELRIATGARDLKK